MAGLYNPVDTSSGLFCAVALTSTIQSTYKCDSLGTTQQFLVSDSTISKQLLKRLPLLVLPINVCLHLCVYSHSRLNTTNISSEMCICLVS